MTRISLTPISKLDTIIHFSYVEVLLNFKFKSLTPQILKSCGHTPSWLTQLSNKRCLFAQRLITPAITALLV
jgi:hypothetical protein